MSFLSKLAKHRVLKDADLFLSSEQAVTVDLSWYLTPSDGTYDPLFKQYEGGTKQEGKLQNVRAEKVILTQSLLSRLGFGFLESGDVIFRFNRDLNLNVTDLKIKHLDTYYYPVLLDTQQQALVSTFIGNTPLYQNVVCTSKKQKSGGYEES